MNLALAKTDTRALSDIFAQARDRLPGAGQVADARHKAFEIFARAGLPHRRIEDWKYTDLRVLMREPGRVFTRTELCEKVWEREHEYDMKLVEVFISRLRRKIDSPPLIHTVRHLGYTIREEP